MKRTLSLLVAASTLALLAPSDAAASGFLVARFGGEHGHVTSDHLTSIYYNPAGLSLLGGTRLFVSGSLAWRDFSYERDPGGIDNILSDPDVGAGTPDGEGVSANSGEGTLFNIAGMPFFGFATDFGVENLGVGVAFFVPFGGASVYDKTRSYEDFPGAEDGPARWWAIEGTIRSMYISTAVAYRIEAIRLSIGLSFNVVLSEVDTIRARNSDGSDHLVNNGRLQEGRALAQVSGLHASLGAGLVWEPIDHLFIGVSYQSQPGFGQMKLDDGDLTLILGSTPTEDVKPTPLEFHQALPDVLRLGARYGEPRVWQARLFGEYVRWSVLESQCLVNRKVRAEEYPGRPTSDFCDLTLEDSQPATILNIPRRWQDAFGIRAGGSWWPDPDVEVYLGAGFDGNAVPDEFLDPALYDTNKASIALGARLSLLDESLLLSATYTQVFYPTRTTQPRGRVPVDANNPNGPTTSDISELNISEQFRQPDAAGTFDQAIGVFELGVEYRF